MTQEKMMPTDETLHAFARFVAGRLADLDKKQLRFNEIVEVAKLFYANDPIGGVFELVQSCDRADPVMYVPNRPMWRVLREEEMWLLGEEQAA